MELHEIKEYWMKKYPNVDITFFPRSEGGKYNGRMHSGTVNCDLQADTIGEFINQGESFLRKVKK